MMTGWRLLGRVGGLLSRISVEVETEFPLTASCSATLAKVVERDQSVW